MDATQLRFLRPLCPAELPCTSSFHAGNVRKAQYLGQVWPDRLPNTSVPSRWSSVSLALIASGPHQRHPALPQTAQPPWTTAQNSCLILHLSWRAC